MDLSQLSVDRKKWQLNTIEVINSMLGLSAADFTLQDSDKENCNVVLYGLPQIGKTTLILTLLGIAPVYLTKVSEILRGGIQYGNSSTATATMYMRSKNQQYGLSYREDAAASSEIHFCTEDEFISRLCLIRSQVEADLHDTRILQIFIPQQYFDSRAMDLSLNIIDMPGADSRNAKEHAHTNRLLDLLFLTANCRIIMCRADSIVGLQNSLSYLQESNWMYYGSQYLLVTTYTYNQESIRKYFRTEKAQRKESFGSYVQSEVEQNIRHILGEHSKVSVFPLELGESYNKLLQYLDDPMDRAEMQQFREDTLNRLYQAIKKRGAHSLRYIVEQIREQAQVKLEQELSDIDRQITDAKTSISNLDNQISITENNLNLVQPEIDEKNELLSKLRKAQDESVPDTRPYYTLKAKYIHNGKYKSNTPEGTVADELENCLIEKSTTYVESVRQTLGDDLLQILLGSSLSGAQLYRRARKNCLSDLSAALRPPGIIGGLFHKISEDTFHSLVTRAVEAFDNYLSSELEAAVRKPLADHEEKINNSVKELEARKKDMSKSIEKYKSDRKMHETKVKALEKKGSEINASLSYCNTLLTRYLEIAQAEYVKEMEACRKKLQSPNITATEKAWVMVLMGLMERDRIAIFNER